MLAARLAPQIVKGFALDFAGKQGADPGAGEAESSLISKIRRQHEGIAKGMANICRIDLGTLRCRTPASQFVPMAE